ncbi:MAG: response regulator [Chitinivibrionales bacterium]|nr:response regulator [Chitinivibrionales bacterium]
MSKKALIVDDSADFAQGVADVLEANGYAVVTATSGEAGFENAVGQKPDVILLDVMMENSGAGLDMLRRLKSTAETAGVPVVLVTGIRKPEFLLESYAPGEQFPNVKKVFEKPVDPKKLVETLETIG